jgi:hypothetical protein
LLLSKRNQFSYAALPVASASHTAHLAARRRLLRLTRLVPRLVAPLVVDNSASRRLVVDYFAYAMRPGASARRAARHAARRAARRRLLRLMWLVSRLVVPLVVDNSASRRLFVDYFAYAARPGASAHRTTRRAARRRLLHLRRASGCLGTSRDSSRGSSSTTSTTPRVRVPRHLARLVAWLVAPLVVDYFTYVARPGALAHRAARRRLLHLRRASGCLGTSRGSSRGSSSTTSPTSRVRVPRHVARHVARLVVDYFTYAARPGASARRAARRVARRRLFRLRRTSGCLGTSRGSLSTSSPTSRVRVPRHVARLVMRLVVDYSVHSDFVLRPHWLYFSHTVCRDYLSCSNTGSTSSTPRATTMSSSSRIASTAVTPPTTSRNQL